MINRRKSKQISIGDVKIGGDAPISVQSMCNTDTRNVEATLNQIYEFASAGCEIARLAVLNKYAAEAIKDIVKKSPIPLVADIHFDYRLALQCIENGIQSLRINPGNIGKREHTEKVVKEAKAHNVPIRIGINAGSLEKEFAQLDLPLHEKMIKSAMRHIEILEDLNFYDIKLSLKSSDVMTTIEAYKKIATMIDYPLHLGVTEAGTLKMGLIKSSIGLGTLLSTGIGDTIRVSLTENPVEEVEAGFGILKSLDLRKRGINFISCPTCGRTQIDLIKLANDVETLVAGIPLDIKVAVMGCVVNGPGEAKEADIGIAGGKGECLLIKKGEIIKKIPEDQLLSALKEELLNWGE